MSSPGRRELLVGLALLGLVSAVFSPVSRAEFLNYDDDTHVVRNPHVASGLSRENARWALTACYKANWMPLTWVSHQLTAQLFGLRAGPHHLMNLGLHAANTLLLFLALRSLTGALWRSAAVAALFAVHPLHVESVAWVAERKDVLSTLFLLLGVLAYRRFVARPRPARLAAVAVLLGFGLAAKPMLVTFPLLLLLLDFWPLGRMRPGPAAGRTVHALLLEKLPLVFLSATVAGITLLAQREAGALNPGPGTPGLGLRAANAAVSAATYLVKTAHPKDLAVYYPFPTRGIPAGRVAGSAALLAGVSIAAALLARRAPWLGFGWLWYLCSLLPVIGLVQVGSQAMADRYTYVPLVGIFVLAVWAAAAAAPGPRARALILAGIALGVLLPTAFLSRRQVGFWRDSATLFAHAAAAIPGNAMAEVKLGDVHAVAGRPQEALAHYRRAQRSAPGSPEIAFDIGLQLAALGDPAGAAAAYREALRLDPAFQRARRNLELLVIRGAAE